MARRWVILVIALAAALVVFGCAKGGGPSGPSAKAGPPARASQEAGPTEAGKAEKITYWCPGQPGTETDQPGWCDSCKAYLEAKVKAGEKVIYTCPMHPEVIQDQPGKCPKCGMFLEAKVVAQNGLDLQKVRERRTVTKGN